MAGKEQAVIVVLDSDSDDDAGGGEPRDGGVGEIGASSSSSMEIVPFVKKLYEIVEGKTESLVRWSWSGTSFIATDPNLFAARVLPIYFKHNRLHSFTRQLNYHGFKKIKSEQWEYEYAHEYFHKGKLHLMKYIINKRQPTSMAKMTRKSTSAKDYRQMRAEIIDLKGKLLSLEEKLASLDNDNDTEVGELHDVQATPDTDDDVQVHCRKRSRHAPPWHGDYLKHLM